jgi:hypothetical protein
MPTKSKSSKSRSSAGSRTTIDHDEIRAWADAREGMPACVKGTGGGGDSGLLRIDFPGFSGEESLQQITWDEFFEKFDEQNLAFLYQEQTRDGEESRFNKLVRRTGAGRGGGRRSSGGKSSRAKSRSGKTSPEKSGRGRSSASRPGAKARSGAKAHSGKSASGAKAGHGSTRGGSRSAGRGGAKASRRSAGNARGR